MTSCLEPYNPKVIQNNDNYLVVEGFLNGNDGTCNIKLSRTIPLQSSEPPATVLNASVVIEDENNSRYIFLENGDGVYSVSNVDINTELKYRLRIVLDNRIYLSEYVPVTQTPPISEIDWSVEEGNIQIYVNTKNIEEGTRYYLWDYTETWKYSSAFRSYFKLENGEIVRRDSPDELFYCWKSNESSEIYIGSSAKLADDIISDFPLNKVPLISNKLQIKYSVLVKQFSLTQEAYDYWSQMKDNSQGMGSFYDKQPSRVTGNIHSVENEDEPVLGYFGAFSFQERRLFIDRKEIPGIGFGGYGGEYKFCVEDTLLVNNIENFIGPELLINEIIEVLEPPPAERFIGYLIGVPYCVDCRLSGGTTIQPFFWE